MEKHCPSSHFLHLYILTILTLFNHSDIWALLIICTKPFFPIIIFNQTRPTSLTFMISWHSHFMLCVTLIATAGQFWAPPRQGMKCNRPIISHQQTFWIWLFVVRLRVCLCWYSRVNYEGPRERFRSGLAIWIGHMPCIYRKGWHV